MQFVTAGGAALSALGFGTYGMVRLDMLSMVPAALKSRFSLRGCPCSARDSALDFRIRGVAASIGWTHGST
jgi:hypothetical protein